MTRQVAFTVDVEDWYEGMEALGSPMTRAVLRRPPLRHLQEILAAPRSRPARLTLFVVGRHAPASGGELSALARDGHEIASHGPDHGQLPIDPPRLEAWLREGKEQVEDVVQQEVRGFRSPRFDVPDGWDLRRFRDAIHDAGFTYVSDTHLLGRLSPVGEIPVLVWRGLPVGGGSYQRVLPRRLVTGVVAAAPGPAVLYYHSYDFGSELPSLRAARSLRAASQLAGRSRVPLIFQSLLARFGSVRCREMLADVV